MTDPQGYEFFSIGVNCVGLGKDCRIDGVEKWLDWLPDREDSQYKEMFEDISGRKSNEEKLRREGRLFSFAQANLRRGIGEDWYEKWQKLIVGRLKQYGMNTIGNWSDINLLGTVNMPYVTSLPEFPTTRQMIFRDFPDVLSKEYEESAERVARALEKRKDDPYMIGYFLRNEPNWAFVDNLILADEVLYNRADTACKRELLDFLKQKYGTIEKLNKAWSCELNSFAQLENVNSRVSAWSSQSCEDMREFSRRMLRAYVEIPCHACRKVDPNHMILGMRWAWISDKDLVSGWENFDVFSINCYAVDPTASLQNIVDLGVDLPIMIGEFHFGALDAGPSATGLEGVRTQKDRGIAYRYYCERVAAHKYGVGCHYFQCYDQFVLGRFDGENYNIGVFDICSQPYADMCEEIKRCSQTLYHVMSGEVAPTEVRAESIPMIAY